MKSLRQALRMDRYRCLQSPLFYISIVILCGIWSFDQFQELFLSTGNTPVLLHFHWRSSASLLAALPFATAFCEDFRNRYLWYSVQRTNIRAYAWSKMLSTVLYTFIANMIATVSFVGILLLRHPLIGTSENVIAFASIPPYGALLLGENPFLYFICVAICESLFMGLLASIALTVSCLLPDFFVTLAIPIICYYGIINAVQEGILSPYRIFMTHSIDMGGPLLSMLYTMGYAFCSIAIIGVLFYYLVKRRIIHG